MIYPTDFLNDQTILTSSAAPSAPLVSVILPTYNRAKGGLLERAIASVLGQTFGDFELLVMDDGSRDGSYEIIERFRRQDPRLIHVRHEINSGLPALRVNEGIELARGQYLAFQFDDDLWRPHALAELVAAAGRQPQPAVIVGTACFHSRGGEINLPLVNLDPVTLTENNRFANNSVLFPHSLVYSYGMYDPHIGMRRLCDWDLWLRLIRVVPFIRLETVISDVFESNVGAIGRIVPWDILLFRFINSIERDSLLTPETWRRYPLDALSIAGVEVTGELRHRLYEEQIVPYYFQKRQKLPKPGGFPANLPPTPRPMGRKTIIYTKASYDVTNEISLNNFDLACTQDGLKEGYKLFYSILSEIPSNWTGDVDGLLLVRTVEEKALELADQALKASLPVGLFLDDDLFTAYEYGPQFSYLAPGTPYYQNLGHLAQKVDAVWVTNQAIGQSVRPFSQRLIPYNGSVRSTDLPGSLHFRQNTRPIKIGYVGTGYRLEEFRQIWPALMQIAEEYANQVTFEFWGIDLRDLPKLAAPVFHRPFTFSYSYYLEQLRQAEFDILLSPLLDAPRPRLGKSYIKYYETAVAGALGIFSDGPQYARLPGGWTCLKARNTSEDWYRALKQALEMPAAEFDQMRRRCLAHVREEFTAEAQVDLFEAALRALEFHALTRQQRGQDGLPRVLYVLHSIYQGGAEIQLWRRLRLARQYGIQPVVVVPQAALETEEGQKLKQAMAEENLILEGAIYACFTEPRSPAEHHSPLEIESLRQVIERHRPALVHSVTFIPSLGQLCQESGLPHVSTLYAVQDDFHWSSGQPDFHHCDLVQSDCWRYARRWSELLGGIPKVCARDLAPEALFEVGQRKAWQDYPHGEGQPWQLVVTGTFQERKQQLETIEALGRLKQAGVDNFRLSFYGYLQFFPEYVERCRQAIQHWGLENQVSINDFSEDIAAILAQADILLSLSTYESFPGSIKDALAAGVLVVATPVGGVPEVINDGVSGILCAGTDVEDLMDGIRRALTLSNTQRISILETGRRIARLEWHPQRAANDLFRMYNLALNAAQTEKRSATAGHPPSQPIEGEHLRPNVSAQRMHLREPDKQPGSIMVVGRGISFTLTPKQDHWSGVSFCFASGPPNGRLNLTVRHPSGSIIRQSSLQLSNAQPGVWMPLHFPPIKNSAGVTFRLELTFAPQQQADYQSIGVFQITYRPLLQRIVQRLLRELGFRLQGGEPYCQEFYSHDS